MLRQLLSRLVPLLDQIHVRLRRADARFGFFLKSVQHIQLGAELYGVDQPVSVLVLALGNLKNTAAHAMERLGVVRQTAQLRQHERAAHRALRFAGKFLESFFGITHPHDFTQSTPPGKGIITN